jgi:hypothetical protein
MIIFYIGLCLYADNAIKLTSSMLNKHPQHTHTHTHTYLHTYIHTSVRAYIYMCVCVYIYTYIYIYIYTIPNIVLIVGYRRIGCYNKINVVFVG